MLARRDPALGGLLSVDARSFCQGVFRAPAIRIENLSPQIAYDSAFLPEPLHRDPADRLLIATARFAGLAIMTRDHGILRYGKLGHVAVIPC